VTALAPAPTSGVTLNVSCMLSTESDGTPGWLATFSNSTSSDIAIESYTVLFFGSSGAQTGSASDASQPFTVAASNTYRDEEYHPDLAPCPTGQRVVPGDERTERIAHTVRR
jgi:hypothetical protein